MHTTRRDYAHPWRPLPVRVLNRVWGALGRPRVSLEAGAWLDAARRAEGLEDFGEAPLDEPLTRFCEALQAEARLNPLGRIIVRARFVGALRARLRTVARLSAHPEIADRALPRPIVITGLQRTGTTFLHRLLAADTRLRALRSWEALNPAPFAGEDGAASRMAAARRAARAVGWLAPDFQAVHPIEAMAPEEEVVLFEQTLVTTSAEATLRVPSFSQWVERTDPTPAYAWLRRILQVLDHAESAEHWVLKTPHHMEWLDVLHGTFPDLRVVHTHRDPLQTVGSFCSMVAHAHGLCSDDVEPAEIGQHWLEKTGRMVDRAQAVRSARPALPVLDVHYGDLLDRPVQTVRGIYAFLDLPFTEQTRAAVEAQRAGNPQHKYGRHVYALEDFGLSEADVRRRFVAYRQRHGMED